MTTSLSPTKRNAIGAVLAAGLAALCIAAPAQADLVSGLKDGGCLQGVQVGHAHHADGSVTPICYIVD